MGRMKQSGQKRGPSSSHVKISGKPDGRVVDAVNSTVAV
jgi:hypothetical protein